MRDNSRFKEAAFRRYIKGSYAIGITPGGAYIIGDGVRIIAPAAEFSLGKFIADRVYVGGSLLVAYCFIHRFYDINIEEPSVQAFYYFSDKARYTPFVGISAAVTRYNYQPIPEIQYFGDPVDGSRRSHYIPRIILPAGVSVKWGKRITTEFGVLWNKPLLSVKGNSPGRDGFDFYWQLRWHPKPKTRTHK